MGVSEYFEIHGDAVIHGAGSHPVILMIFHIIHINMPATGFLWSQNAGMPATAGSLASMSS